MNQIEAEAKKYVEPLVRGEESAPIDLDAQWAISRWAYLKVLLFERVDTRHYLLPESRYHEMHESSRGEPTLPANMSVFLAAHEGERVGQYAHRLLADANTRKPELFIGTITIRHLIVQVIEDIADDGEVKTFQHDHRVGGHEARIWPSEPFIWPPGLALPMPALRSSEGLSLGKTLLGAEACAEMGSAHWRGGLRDSFASTPTVRRGSWSRRGPSALASLMD
jgi:hypothetical protein